MPDPTTPQASNPPGTQGGSFSASQPTNPAFTLLGIEFPQIGPDPLQPTQEEIDNYNQSSTLTHILQAPPGLLADPAHNPRSGTEVVSNAIDTFFSSQKQSLIDYAKGEFHTFLNPGEGDPTSGEDAFAGTYPAPHPPGGRVDPVWYRDP